MTVLYYASPTFYNKWVQDVNEYLSALPWLENIYPIARVGVDEEGTFPEVYRNDGERKSERIFPHGNSISFFEVGGYAQIEDDFWYSVDMSVIVWADLTKAYPDKNYDYTIELINDVVAILEMNGAYELDIDESTPFENYSQLEKIINQNTMRPHSAFRIDFTVNLLLCC